MRRLIGRADFWEIASLACPGQDRRAKPAYAMIILVKSYNTEAVLGALRTPIPRLPRKSTGATQPHFQNPKMGEGAAPLRKSGYLPPPQPSPKFPVLEFGGGQGGGLKHGKKTFSQDKKILVASLIFILSVAMTEKRHSGEHELKFISRIAAKI